MTALVVSASALSYSSLEATVTKIGTTTVFDTSTLNLTAIGYNETSQPYGSTSYCGGVVP